MAVDPSTADREFTLTRLLAASPERVFAAWTDPRHLDRWWGPRGFTTTTETFDLRPGGAWILVMRGPDGQEYPNHITFTEIQAPLRLCYAHGAGADDPQAFQVTIDFSAEAGGTRITLRALFSSAEILRQMRKAGAVEAGQSTVDQFEELLAEQAAAAAPGEFVIARVLHAPRERVWRAHMAAEQLERWWGPTGFKVQVLTLDPRPGGHFHYRMESADGHVGWGRFVYREIEPLERLVWVNSFSDEQGGVTRHPMAADWPLEMLVSAEFRELDGRTLLLLRSRPEGATAAECAVFEAGFGSMRGGFGGTFNQLAEHLARVS